MRKVTYICNRCQKEIQGEKMARVFLSETNIKTDNIEPEQKFRGLSEVELCEECAEQLNDHLQLFFAGIERYEDSEEVMKEIHIIDKGKVKALYKAKWNISDISREMGCSEETVRMILKSKKRTPK